MRLRPPSGGSSSRSTAGCSRFPYSDIALLGLLVTRGPHWRAVGWTLHIVNGAVAGLVFWALFEHFGGNAFWFADRLRDWSSISSPTR